MNFEEIHLETKNQLKKQQFINGIVKSTLFEIYIDKLPFLV